MKKEGDAMIIRTIGGIALLAYMISVTANIVRAEDKKASCIEIINNIDSKEEES